MKKMLDGQKFASETDVKSVTLAAAGFIFLYWALKCGSLKDGRDV